eukprot:1149527-Pelagomonas_calceolata.AAC.4
MIHYAHPAESYERHTASFLYNLKLYMYMHGCEHPYKLPLKVGQEREDYASQKKASCMWKGTLTSKLARVSPKSPQA